MSIFTVTKRHGIGKEPVVFSEIRDATPKMNTVPGARVFILGKQGRFSAFNVLRSSGRMKSP
jgi:hypothetical protein